jgi:hypothetical protein
MVKTYCGNNANFQGLITGTHIVGTNYQCLRKGIGVGKNLPYDESFSGNYTPIDPRTFYCGNSDVIPNNMGYFAVGWPAKCLQTGIGIGKARKAVQKPPFGMNFIRYYLPYLLFIIIVSIIFVIFYFIKPKFLTKQDPYDQNKRNIDFDKLIPYMIISALVVGILLYCFWKNYVKRWI